MSRTRIPFSDGDTVRINAPHDPELHGRTGVVRRIASEGLSADIVIDGVPRNFGTCCLRPEPRA